MVWILVIVGVVVIWAICGIIGYGLEFAYWQRKWPEFAKSEVAKVRLLALVMVVLGPLGLIFFLSQESYGIMFTPDWKYSPFESFILPPNGNEE